MLDVDNTERYSKAAQGVVINGITMQHHFHAIGSTLRMQGNWGALPVDSISCKVASQEQGETARIKFYRIPVDDDVGVFIIGVNKNWHDIARSPSAANMATVCTSPTKLKNPHPGGFLINVYSGML